MGFFRLKGAVNWRWSQCLVLLLVIFDVCLLNLRILHDFLCLLLFEHLDSSRKCNWLMPQRHPLKRTGWHRIKTPKYFCLGTELIPSFFYHLNKLLQIHP